MIEVRYCKIVTLPAPDEAINLYSAGTEATTATRQVQCRDYG